MPAPDVAALLSQLERAEPDAAEDARIAIEWLTGGEPLETVTQLDVCEFLWYTLPLKIDGDVERHARVARALGRLLGLGGMERYAGLCESATTRHILRVYARSGEAAGTAAYRAALDATGVLPPDTTDLRWSSIMGPEELGAHLACSAALELAIVSGELRLGAGSWKSRREALTHRWLTASRSELGGDSWLNRVHGERLNRWVLGRGTLRRDLAQAFEVRLHAPVPVPQGPHFRPLRWLLARAAEDGLPLTQRLNLSRATVVAAAERFGWDAAGGRTPRSETEVPTLMALRGLAQGDLRALRRTGRRLVLTAAGRRLLQDPERLFRAGAATLLSPGEHELDIWVHEAALMLLADGEPVPWRRLRDRVIAVVGGESWRDSAPADVIAPLARLRRRMDALELRLPCDGLDQLTPVGRAAALTALRTHALRPRQYVVIG